MLKVHFLVEPHYLIDRKIVRSVLQLAAKKVNLKVDAQVTVSIIGDRKMRLLNNQFRGLDKTTNVLSFTSSDVESIAHFQPRETEVLYIGDVAISYPVAREEAIKENVLVDERVAYLAVHGFLHLFGHDHQESEEAKVMEDLEDEVLSELKIPEIIK